MSTNTNRQHSARAPREHCHAHGFSLIDIILTLVILGTVGGTLFGFFSSLSNIDDPVQRFQADNELKYAVENILADYRNNFWRSWNESPPQDFDVCDDGLVYPSRVNASRNLTSSLVLFRNEVTANSSKYGNFTLIGTSCGLIRGSDPLDMQQLRIFIESADNTTTQVVTVGK